MADLTFDIRYILEREELDHLVRAVKERGYKVVGPTLRDGAITYDEVSSAAEFPGGWTDEQEGGSYRLVRRGDAALFGYAAGQHSWKRHLHSERTRLWSAVRNGADFQLEAGAPKPSRLAFFGVRSCDLHAIFILDTVFQGGKIVDPAYAALRQNLLIIAVQCAEPGKTCFCASMNTGPEPTGGFDLALTEVLKSDRHFFVLRVGSRIGAELMGVVPHREAGAEECEQAELQARAAVARMARSMNTTGIKDLLYASYGHPRWNETADRCFGCANCTMVCPTCFCSTVEDVTSLTAARAERWRRWDSCFTVDFSYIHGGSVRPSRKARYRQWITHKLASWMDQFGTSGCVGCGRCITWCPAGIDITEEIAAIRNATPNETGSALPREQTNGQDS